MLYKCTSQLLCPNIAACDPYFFLHQHYIETKLNQVTRVNQLLLDASIFFDK